MVDKYRLKPRWRSTICGGFEAILFVFSKRERLKAGRPRLYEPGEPRIGAAMFSMKKQIKSKEIERSLKPNYVS